MGDYFKVVAVLQKRRGRIIMEYSFVPHKWVKEDVLFWPKNNLSALRRDSGSTPGKNWLQYKCKVKKSNIFGLEEAQLWEEEYVNASSTEAEGSITIHKIPKKATNIAPRTEIDDMFATLESNALTSSQKICRQASNPASTIVPGKLSLGASYCTDTTPAHVTEEIVNASEPSSSRAEESFMEYGLVLEDGVIVPNDSEDVSVDTNASGLQLMGSDQNRLLTQISEIQQQLNDLAEKQSRIESHQQKIIERHNSSFLELRASNEKMYCILKDIKSVMIGQELGCNKENRPESFNVYKERFLFPLRTVQDVLEFNKEISNRQEYKKYLIENYSTIGGTQGNEDGKVVAKKLLSIVFTKHVLTLFSWTGISRTSGIEKKELFHSCEGILSLFQDVVHMADSRWNLNKNEKFFKLNTLKHAKQMKEAFENKKKSLRNEEQEISCDFISDDVCRNSASILSKGKNNFKVESGKDVGSISADDVSQSAIALC